MLASHSCATGAKGTCLTLWPWPRGMSRRSMACRYSSPRSTYRTMRAMHTCSDATPCVSRAGAAHPVIAPFYGICRTCTAKHPAQLPHSAWLIAAVARLSVLIARRPRRPDDARLTRVARRSADSLGARHEDVEACRFWQVYHVTCTNSGRTDAGRRRKRERTGREASDDAVAA